LSCLMTGVRGGHTLDPDDRTISTMHFTRSLLYDMHDL
jgi:hypothetical protein